MLKAALAFLLGVLILATFESLPHVYWSLGILPIIVAIFKYPPCRLLGILLLGFLCGLVHGHLKLLPSLDRTLEGVDLEVVGQIVSIPTENARSSRFEFSIQQARRLENIVTLPKKVRLNWYGKVPELELGEIWQLRIRLKRPWGFANPGGFDYEKWLFEKSIRATGYVRSKGNNVRLKPTSITHPTFYLRAKLHQKITAVHSQYQDIIQALVLGERGEMSAERWQTLTQTGTNHLLAISGLHVGIVSGFVYLILLFLWRRSEYLCLLIAAQRVAALAAICAAILYAMLAGFSIPTQRAMVMAAVVFAAVYFMNSLKPWNILSLALICVLLFDPFSVLSPGFWLSFTAVAIILFSIKKQPKRQSWWLGLVKVQFVLSIGLLPLTLFFFQQASLVSPLANYFAVPWVSFLVVPFTLVGSLLLLINQSLGAWVLNGAEFLLNIFWSVLEFLHTLPFSSVHHALPAWSIIPVALGILLLLAPRGLPAKLMGITLLTPLIFAQPEVTPVNNLKLTVLDVGQGLALVLEVGEKVLVYDTGPKFGSSFNAGDAVLVPYLRHRGIKKIDILVVSHGDKDHAGGLKGTLANMDVVELLTSENESSFQNAEFCVSGHTWQWGRVKFKFLHPDSDDISNNKLSTNNRSCVLRVQHPAGSVLLTGDIEKRIERDLIEENRRILDIDVLIAPHHGSKSSSTGEFINSTTPDYVVFTTGYRNPYGFPDKNVVSRYKEFGSRLVNTASHGMITFDFSDKHGLQLQPGYREQRKRFWHSEF